MTPKELFKEFMILGYYPGNRISGLHDISLHTYTIARITSDGWNIINFYNGTNIFIPWELVDLIESLNVWGGHRILNCSGPEDIIDFTIIKFIELVNSLNKREGSAFINIISRICSSGTQDFRDWFKKEFGKSISPIELNTLENLKTI